MTGMIHQCDLTDIKIDVSVCLNLIEKIYLIPTPNSRRLIIIALSNKPTTDTSYSRVIKKTKSNDSIPSAVRSLVTEMVRSTKYRIPSNGRAMDKVNIMIEHITRQVQSAIYPD